MCWSIQANLAIRYSDLMKDEFRVTNSCKFSRKDWSCSQKLHKFKQKLTNMSGRGKGKSSKKAVSRSAKAGLQFPVGRIARYVICIVYILHSMRARYWWCILEKMMECDRSSNNRFWNYKHWPLLNSLSIHKQIPQGWQIRHPCWCWCPCLLGRGLGILSGWSSRTRR